MMNTLLQQVFSSVLYPLLLAGTLVLVVWAVTTLIREGMLEPAVLARIRAGKIDKKHPDVKYTLRHSAIRRIVGASVPVVLLVALVVAGGDTLRDPLQHVPTSLALGVGCVLGVVGVEVGKLLRIEDTDVGYAIATLALSLTGVFIVYSVMENALGPLNALLFSTLIAGGLDVVFRNLENTERKEKKAAADPGGPVLG